MLNIKAKTVDFILNNLKEKKIKYAVLRNFEKLPDIGRDLDILVDNNIKEIQRIILKSAKKFNWTHLILDQSKSRYFINNNKVLMFYLINYQNLDFLQIDLFRSTSIFSTPYYTINNMNLETFKKKYYIVPKNVSYTYNLFQINSLLKNKSENYKKILRYRKNFLKLDFDLIFRKNIFFEEKLLKKISQLIKEKSFINFRKYIFIYIFLILINYFFKNPLRFYYLLNRSFEYTLLYFFQPSGFELDIFFKNNNKKKIIKDFNNLKRKKFISKWSFNTNKGIFDKIIFLQQRNILINQINQNQDNNKIDYTKIFLKKLIKKNILIFGKKI